MDPKETDRVKIVPLLVDVSPKLEDMVGVARIFCDEFIEDTKAEQIYRSMAVEPNSTFLLTGVPGTGKTMAIKAMNNTLNQSVYAKAISEGPEKIEIKDMSRIFIEYSLGHHGTPYINQGSRNVQSVVDQAGLIAQYGVPTTLVLDECDAVLGARGVGQQHAEDRKVLETIMKNLQIIHDTDNFSAILMTNLPEICDPASIRAGRIDKIYKFELPNKEERRKAYETMIDCTNAKAGYMVIRSFDLDQLADTSDRFSYADIRQSIDQAIKLRAREISSSKKKGIIPAGYVTQKRLLQSNINHAEKFKSKSKPLIGF